MNCRGGRNPSRRRRLAFASTVIVTAVTLLSTQHAVDASYWVSGSMRVATVEGQIDTASGVVVATELHDSATKTAVGPGGLDIADARYDADLAHGSLGAYAEAINNSYPIPWPLGPWSTAQAWVDTGFQDTLRFTIPAGTYAEAVQATLRGSVHGNLQVVGDDTYHAALAHFYVNFRQVFSDDVQIVGYSAPRDISETFAFTIPLLAAGTTLTAPLEVGQDLRAELTVFAGAGYNSSYPLSGLATSDFYSTTRFSSLEVPTGVTWTSDSGVFMTSLVAEPSSTFLAGLGLTVLILLYGFRDLRDRRWRPRPGASRTGP